MSLAVPALRVFRLARALRLLRIARVVRGARLVSVVGSMNRGMRALRTSLGRRGFGYVAALTSIITLVGAAGMYAFEANVPGGGYRSYGDALWWTAMIMTTMGTDYWPRTSEGRFLTLLMSVYAFAVFGYVTAAVATFFIGRESGQAKAPESEKLRALGAEISALREEIRSHHPPA